LCGRRFGEEEKTQITRTIKDTRILHEKSKQGKTTEPLTNLLYLIEITKGQENLTTALYLQWHTLAHLTLMMTHLLL